MDSIGQRSRWERFSRLVGSWVGLTAIFCLGLGVIAIAANTFDARLHHRALADIKAQGELIATLVTHQEFTEADLDSGLPVSAEQRMRARVHSLRAGGEVLGFQLWTAAGVLVFAEPAAGPGIQADIRREVTTGRNLVAEGQQHGGTRSDHVLVRLDLDLVAVVLLAPNQLDQIRATALTRLGWVGAVLGLLLAAALALARRRQGHREHAARHDQLTGLGNRTLLAEETQARARHPYALLLLDLDSFKDVNDTLGHAAGDELLVQVAAALRRGVRKSDVVLRLGGDEFAILLDAVGDPDQASRIARGVLDKLAQSGCGVRGIDLDVHASVGVAINGPAVASGSALLRQADVAMYRAKGSTEAVVLYSEDTDHHDTDRLAMLGELRRAIAADELVLHYQPIIETPDLARRAGAGVPEVTTVEALVRWQHPQRGLLAPQSFIPVAEHTGVIHALTAWVLDHAVAQAASWRRSGLDLAVSVNLSPRAINESLVSLVLTTLHRHDLPANRLTLEITETAVTEDAASTIAILRELRTAGVRISLDDFGAGYTSLAYLTALPLTELKLDQCLVAAVSEHGDTSAVVAAVIKLGHQLGLTVVAEGVETEATSRELAALGCDCIQGFLYSHPLRPEQVEGWVTARNAAHQQAVHRA